MSRPDDAPLLCRWGFHAWRFLEAKPSRTVGLSVVCDRRDRCQRCGLTMRREQGPVPGRRVRIWQDPDRGSSTLAALTPLLTAPLLALTWLMCNHLEGTREVFLWCLVFAGLVGGVLWPLAKALAACPPLTEHLRDEASVLTKGEQ